MSVAAISALERGSRRAPYRSSVDLLADGLGIGQEERARLHALADRRRKVRALPPARRPNNLPFQISSFVGRKKELDDLRGLLSRSRLLTVVGPGGVGKTRLILELARELLDEYADGAFLVDLTTVQEAALVPSVVAAHLNVAERENEPIEKSITGDLLEKHALIVVDNAEHLLAAVTAIAKAILQRCARVTVAVTSREPLHVAGEQVYRLGPLAGAPDASDLQSLSRHDSTGLFVERARDVNPSIEFSEAECRVVATLCERLEGMPLAIELACARLSSLTIGQLENRLTSSLMLVSRDATELPRRRTIRDTIAWSYELLPRDEQSALLAMAVFAGGCTANALRAVAIDIRDVDEAVDSLTDKSLLQVDDSATEERWRLLDSVRDFANERLVAEGIAESTARNHAAYYIELVGTAGKNEEPVSYAMLDHEVSNIRRALDWSIGSDRRAARNLVLALAPYWRTRGMLAEANSWVTRMLGCDLDEKTRTEVLCVGASFATLRDELRESLRLAREALAISGRLEDASGVAHALFRIAEAEHRQGDLDAAETDYGRSLDGFRACAEVRGEILCIGNLGVIARQRHDLQRAADLLDEAIQKASASGESRIAGEFAIAMGWVRLDMNDVGESRRLFERVFEANDETRHPLVSCSARYGLATVALKERRLEDALKECLATLHAAREFRLSDYFARAFHGIAAVLALQGDLPTATRFLGFADRLFERSGRRLHDSFAYEVAAAEISARVPELRRAALMAEGAAMRAEAALARLTSAT